MADARSAVEDGIFRFAPKQSLDGAPDVLAASEKKQKQILRLPPPN